MAPAAVDMIEQHRPWKMMDNMMLIIIDQTYTAALEVPGRRELGGGAVEVKSTVEADDPDSPVLTIHASARHCCIAFNNPRGDDVPYKKYTCPKQKMRPCYRLDRTCISVSSGTLFLSRFGGGDPKDYWACADVRPDVAAGGALAILNTITLRLDAAIRLEKTLLIKANAINSTSPSVDEIIETRNALEAIRSEMDLPAMMRRRLQKRRHVAEDGEITRRPDQDEPDETTLMKRFRTMRFG
ncbi:hypothetical protein ABZP36_010641 [Zizania latifolia]